MTLATGDSVLIESIAVEGDFVAVLASSSSSNSTAVFVRVFVPGANDTWAQMSEEILRVSGVTFETAHWLAASRNRTLAVCLPEVRTCYVYAVPRATVGGALARISQVGDTSESVFGRTVAFTADGSLLVGATSHALLFALANSSSAGGTTSLASASQGASLGARSRGFEWLGGGHASPFSLSSDNSSSSAASLQNATLVWKVPDKMQLSGAAGSFDALHVSSYGSNGSNVVLAVSSSATTTGAEVMMVQSTGPGEVWNVNSLSVTLCPPGTYKNGSSIASCVLCPGGSYQPNFGQTGCLACNASKVCPPGSPAQLPQLSSSLEISGAHSIQFPVEDTDEPDALALKHIVAVPTSWHFIVHFSVLGLVILAALVIVFYKACCARRCESTGTCRCYTFFVNKLIKEPLKWFDRESEPEFDRETQTITHVGSVTGGIVTVWMYTVCTLGVIFAVTYSISFTTCTLPYVPAYADSFVDPFSNASLSRMTQLASTNLCPSMDNANIARSSAVQPLSSMTTTEKELREQLLTYQPMNVSVGLVGFSSWTTSCASLCSSGGVSLQSSGCIASETECSSSMSLTCTQLTAEICVVSSTLPLPYSLSDTASFAFNFSRDVFATAVEALVYQPSIDFTLSAAAGQATHVMGSYARTFVLPSVSGKVLRGDVTARTLYAVGVRETTTLGTDSSRFGFIEFTSAQTGVPPTSSVTDVLFGDTNLAVTVELVASQFWIKQSEGPQLNSIELFFSIALTILLLRDSSELIYTLFEWLRGGCTTCRERCTKRRSMGRVGSHAAPGKGVFSAAPTSSVASVDASSLGHLPAGKFAERVFSDVDASGPVPGVYPSVGDEYASGAYAVPASASFDVLATAPPYAMAPPPLVLRGADALVPLAPPPPQQAMAYAGAHHVQQVRARSPADMDVEDVESARREAGDE